jgi:pyruvate carboxylase
MLLRASNAVGYTAYPDNVGARVHQEAAAQGIDIFRIFDSLNWLPNMKVAMEAVRKTGNLRSGHLLHRRHPRPGPGQVPAASTTCDGERARADGRAYARHQGHGRGLCKPYAAEKLVRALREEIGIPIHFHTHDTSGIKRASVLKAAEAGVDVADGASRR